MGIFGYMLLLLFHLLLLLLMLMPSSSSSSSSSYARQLSSTPSNSRSNSTEELTNLIDFKESSVHSDPHGILANWTADSSSPCSWQGVSCSVDGHVTSINLVNLGLVGSLHLPPLTALPYLQHLNLQGNVFSAGDLSASKASPCNLQAIDLSSNNITGPLPARSFLMSCGRLASVNLSRNSISGGGGGGIHFGPSLLQLDLSRNQISDSDLLSSTLSSCQNLNLLNFSDNKLAGKLNVTPSSCKSVSIIDLSYNLLSGEIPATFVADSQGSLKHLDLSHINFS